MLCFGTSNTIGSLWVGILGKYTGRLPMFLTSFILNLGTIAFLQYSGHGREMYCFLYISLYQPFGEYVMQYGIHKVMVSI